MEIHNGIIHIKVSLDSLSKSLKRPSSVKTIKRPQKRPTHKPTLSLTIPSQTSPRLTQIKESIAKPKIISNENLCPSQLIKVKSTVIVEGNKKGREVLRNKGKPLESFTNFCTAAPNVNSVSSYLGEHARKLSVQSARTVMVPANKPPSLIRSIKYKRTGK